MIREFSEYTQAERERINLIGDNLEGLSAEDVKLYTDWNMTVAANAAREEVKQDWIAEQTRAIAERERSKIGKRENE